MKRIFQSVLLATVSTFADDSTAPNFSKYPKSEGFDYFVQAHRAGDFFERRISDRRQKPDSKPSSFEPLILAISHFWCDRGDSAIEYFVTISGYATNCREIYNWATQDSHGSQLTPDQLTKLKDAITKLPTTNSYPPLGQFVIVSFRVGDTWVTRTCRPEDVQSIYIILGERFETARKTK